MNKIFKYEIKEGKTKIPKGARILRIDHVDDGFYNGDYLWAIVDTEEKEMLDFNWDGNMYSAARTPDNYMLPFRIKVKEKQSVQFPDFKIKCAGEFDGEIRLWCEPDPGNRKTTEIVVYKTGQEIDIPIDKLKYLGLNRLWIVMELGLYTFEILP